MIYCGYCGAGMKEDMKFCTKCGERLDQNIDAENAISYNEDKPIATEMLSEHEKKKADEDNSCMGFLINNIEVCSISIMLLMCCVCFYIRMPLLSTTVGVLLLLLCFMLLVKHKKYSRITIVVMAVAIILIFLGVDLEGLYQ